MKILSIGNDISALQPDSALSKRIVEYGDLVEKYTVFVPAKNNQEVKLSDKASVFGASGNNKIFSLLHLYVKTSKELVKEKYSIITVQDQYYLALLGWLLAKKFKLGLEIQIHGFEKFNGIRKRIASFVIPKADSIRTVSERTRLLLVNTFNVKKNIITVVPIFQELKIKNYELKNNKNKENKFVFLTVGRLVKIKNIGMQIEAFADLARNHDDLELWIVGDGPEKTRLEEKSKKLEIGNQVKFFGQQKDLEKFYSQADCFLLTSESEGWGLAVIEAAAYSLPIIMTDVGCAGEVIKDGESGMIIPPGNREMLSYAMVRIIRDYALRGQLSLGAAETVQKLPDKNKTLGLYLESWKKAIRS